MLGPLVEIAVKPSYLTFMVKHDRLGTFGLKISRYPYMSLVSPPEKCIKLVELS